MTPSLWWLLTHWHFIAHHSVLFQFTQLRNYCICFENGGLIMIGDFFFPPLPSSDFQNQPTVPSVHITRQTSIAAPPFWLFQHAHWHGLQSLSFCSINLSPKPSLWCAIRNQSVQLAGRLVTEINGMDPTLTGSDWCAQINYSMTHTGFGERILIFGSKYNSSLYIYIYIYI